MPKSTLKQVIENAIYFGGRENLTNIFQTIANSPTKVRPGALPVNIIISASTNIDVDRVIPLIEQLKNANAKLFVVVLDVNGKSSKFVNILERYTIPLINVKHWDLLDHNIYTIRNYLSTVL